VFLPHRLNVQLAGVEIAHEDIARVRWRPIVRAGNVMATTVEIEVDGGTEVFVVKDARTVAERIAVVTGRDV